MKVGLVLKRNTRLKASHGWQIPFSKERKDTAVVVKARKR